MGAVDEDGRSESPVDRELKAYFRELSQAVRCPENVRLGRGGRVVRRGASGWAVLVVAGLLLAMALAAIWPRLIPGLLAQRPSSPVVLTERQLAAAELSRVSVKFITPSALSAIGKPDEVYVLEPPNVGAKWGVGQVRSYARFVYTVEGKPLVITEEALKADASPSSIIVRIPGPKEGALTNQVRVTHRKTQFVVEGEQPVAVLLQVAQALAGP